MKKLSMSMYCRRCHINIIEISKKSNKTLCELNTMYSKDVSEFNKFVDFIHDLPRAIKNIIPLELTESFRISADDFISYKDIKKIFNVTTNRIKAWIILGVESVVIDNIRYVNCGSICELISSGRA